MIRKLWAEALGTALLLAVVVGSANMAHDLAGGNAALALLCNSIATGLGLYFLITILAPISGAHLNPAVSLYFAATGEIGARDAALYVAVQIPSAVAGVWLAHAMFGLDIIQISTTPRSGGGLWLSEAVSTFGLLMVIAGGLRSKAEAVPALVGAYIAAGYWFTSSSSFANPAVTIARGFTDTAAGIAPAHIAGYVIAQTIGAILAIVLLPKLFSR
ncbi:MAG: aquaporin family protein [Rhodobacteraceae bacterium]|nr:aquaporin family protein [Paracoccaceae bacterium]